MRRNIKTSEAIFPMPVLMIATYNEDGSLDAMNAAWGTMLSRNQVILKHLIHILMVIIKLQKELVMLLKMVYN